MTENKKTIKEIKSKLREAIKSDGFFITLTTKKGNQLFHYHAYVNFYEIDVLPSIEIIHKNLINQINPPLQITTTKAEA